MPLILGQKTKLNQYHRYLLHSTLHAITSKISTFCLEISVNVHLCNVTSFRGTNSPYFASY